MRWVRVSGRCYKMLAMGQTGIGNNWQALCVLKLCLLLATLGWVSCYGHLPGRINLKGFIAKEDPHAMRDLPQRRVFGGPIGRGMPNTRSKVVPKCRPATAGTVCAMHANAKQINPLQPITTIDSSFLSCW